MLDFILWFFYVGGIFPAFRAAMQNNQGYFLSCLNAIAWPADVGWTLAAKFCESHKE